MLKIRCHKNNHPKHEGSDMTVSVFQAIPKRTIQKQGKQAIIDITEWFRVHPRRRMCIVDFWYGQRCKIRKAHIAQDIQSIVKKSLAM